MFKKNMNYRTISIFLTFIFIGAADAMIDGPTLIGRGLAAEATISNAEPRRDVQGNILDAHDGCLEYFEGRFYLYGTRYGKTDGFGKTNRYVCYSSPDLTSWTAHGEMLKDAPPRVYYRPYVKFNKQTGKYVLWYNAIDQPGATLSQFGVAVADRPSGPFIIVNPNVAVKHSEGGVGDMGLFVDDDGTGYLAYTVGVGGSFDVKDEPIPHHQIRVMKLTPDYLGTTSEVSAAVAGNCESPAMFKRNNLYYLLFDNTCCFCPEGSIPRGNANLRRPADQQGRPLVHRRLQRRVQPRH